MSLPEPPDVSRALLLHKITDERQKRKQEPRTYAVWCDATSLMKRVKASSSEVDVFC